MAKKKKTWRCNGDTCEAHTKSEARAEFKRRRKLKRLPTGEVVELVRD